MSGASPFYVPALRMKAGELEGVRALAPDVADCTLPRMIVPPPAERDDALQPSLLEVSEVPDLAGALAGHWRDRDVFIEGTHLVDEFGRDSIGVWYPSMFERARKSRVRAIPLVQIRDLISTDSLAYQHAVDRAASLQLGLVISSGDLGDREMIGRATEVLGRIGLTPEQCAVLADFHDADLSTPEVVAPIIGAALEDLQAMARWQQVVFQGTHYPETNPAEANASHLVPRNEWEAWRRAVAFDPQTAAFLVFGDYAADCARMNFRGSGARAIRHYRYTTSDAWLVQRGAESGRDQQIMEAVCKAIVESGHFAGRTFSTADDYIYKTAMGRAGPGNAKDWRAINTTHHITRVVSDVGFVRGRAIEKLAVEPLQEQIALAI